VVAEAAAEAAAVVVVATAAAVAVATAAAAVAEAAAAVVVATAAAVADTVEAAVVVAAADEAAAVVVAAADGASKTSTIQSERAVNPKGSPLFLIEGSTFQSESCRPNPSSRTPPVRMMIPSMKDQTHRRPQVKIVKTSCSTP
jgi:hypothetical protein